MAQAKGASGVIKIQKETTYGVEPVAPSMVHIPFASETLSGSRGNEFSDMITSVRNPTRPAVGDFDASGGFVTELGANIIRVFEGIFGSVTTTGAGPYTHVFKVGASLPSYLIEKGYTDLGKYVKYPGFVFNKMSFDVTHKGFVKLTCEGMAAQESAIGSASFDASSVALAKASFDGFAISTIEEGGSPIANVQAITGLTFENDLDGDSFVIGGGGKRGYITPGIVKVSGTIRALFETEALLNKAKNRTESSLKIKYTKGDGLGSAGNESLELFIPELQFEDHTPKISGPKGLFVELPFAAYVENDANNSALMFTVKNSIAAP